MYNRSENLSRQEEIASQGLCVVLALESIASHIAEVPLTLPPELIDLRVMHLSDEDDLIRDRIGISGLPDGRLRRLSEGFIYKRKISQLFPVHIRLDKFVVREYIRMIAEDASEIGAVYRGSERHFLSGTLYDAVFYAEQGWQVGVVASFDIQDPSAHFFHLGVCGGIPVSLSDFGETKRVADYMLSTNSMSKEFSELQRRSGGWNILLVG